MINDILASPAFDIVLGVITVSFIGSIFWGTWKVIDYVNDADMRDVNEHR